MRGFRFGFLCHHQGDGPADTEEWSRVRRIWSSWRREEFLLWFHREAHVETFERPEGSVVIVGDAYSQTGRLLSDLVAAAPWEDPWPALDEIGGRYAFLLLSSSEMRVAHDAFGSRSLFYSPRHNAVASHSKLLAWAYDLAPSDEIVRFMERPEYKARTVHYLPGDVTPSADVYALVPNNCWDGVRTHRYWPRAPRAATDRDGFLAEARRYLDAFAASVTAHYTPVFGLTGGIDSRAVLAAFHRKFQGVTWTHHFPRSERPIVDETVAYLSISHKYLTPRDHKRGTVTQAAGIANGGLRPAHLVTEAMAAAYPGAGHVFIRGYGGEILRGFPAYQDRIPDLSPQSMTRAYNSSIRKCVPSADYIAFCEGMFTGFRARANYAGLEGFGYKSMDHFYWEHRMGIWGAAMLNEMDPGIYSMVGFNSRPLYEAAFGLPDEVRLSKALLAAVAELYDPGLAAIPITGSLASRPVQRRGAAPKRRRPVSASSTLQSWKRILTAVRRWLRGWGAAR